MLDSDRVIQVSYVLMVSDRCDFKERRVMWIDREMLLANSRMHPLHRVLNTQRCLKTLLVWFWPGDILQMLMWVITLYRLIVLHSNIQKASGLAHTFSIIIMHWLLLCFKYGFIETGIIVEKLKVHVGGVDTRKQ